ncbi:MAG: TolC family protein [Bryobacteraceae bacterium]
MRRLLLLAATLAAARAEVHTLTLRQTADLALRQSPDALLARLEQKKAASQVDLARDAFHPKIYAGSGLAYVYGFPQSIEGAAPSVVQARAVASIYDKRQKLLVAQARENVRGAGEAAGRKSERALAEAIGLHLEAERMQRMAVSARAIQEGSARMAAIVEARVNEGREIRLELEKAKLEVIRAEQKIAEWDGAREHMEALLAVALGFPEGDRAHPAGEERTMPEVPASLDAVVESAAQESREIRELESAIAASSLRVEAERAARYPKLDLVAQYGLFAKFNNYEDYFRRFQRNNAQIGVSVQVPLWLGPAAKALVAQAEGDAAGARVELNRARGRIRVEAEQRLREVREAETAQTVARRELEVSRAEVSVELARMEEGRTTMQSVERARIAEQERWAAYLAVRERAERARYALLERTGGLVAALQ